YFSDAEYFEQICGVENALIDRYVRGGLSRNERERFERGYLITPVRRQKVAFAKSLARATAHTQTADAPALKESRVQPLTWLQSILAGLRGVSLVAKLSMAMVLLLLIGGVWAAFKISKLNRDLIASNQQRSEIEERERELERQIAEGRAKSDELAKELAILREKESELENQQTRPQTTIPSILSFVLAPGGVRGEGAKEPKTLSLAPGADFVRLQVRFDGNDYSIYEATVRTVDGAQVFKQ